MRQKCKIQWLKEEDQNTKFFHSYLKTRRNNNSIFTIKDTKRVHHTEIEEVSRAFVEYYIELLGTKNRNRKHVCRAISQTGKLVTDTQSEDLKRKK